MSNAREFAKGPLVGFRNLLINGAMVISQRGGSFSNPLGTYTLDRWIAAPDNNTGLSYTIDWVAAFQNATDYAARYPTVNTVLRASVSTKGSCSFIDIKQKIEGVGIAQGKQLTVSFLHRYATTAKTISVHYIQDFGSGGSASVSGQLETSKTASAAAGFTLLSFTGTLPSTKGKTLGPNHNLTIVIRVAVPENSEFVDLTNVQAEIDRAATPFEHRPYATELRLCQRYYEFGGWKAHASASSEYLAAPVYFKTNKRVAPTLSITSTLGTGYAAGKINVDNVDKNGAIIPSTTNDALGSAIIYLSNQTTTLNQFASCNWVANAEI